MEREGEHGQEIDLCNAKMSHICRLCLKSDNFAREIFATLGRDNKEENVNSKLSLDETIFQFFHIKICKEDGLPTSICKTCLLFLETLCDFSNNVQKCEDRLQQLKLIKNSNDKLSESANKFDITDSELCLPNFVPDESCIVTVVDPNADCESSDDDFSMDSDNEEDHHPQPPPPPKVQLNGNSYIQQALVVAENKDAIHGPAEPPKNTFFCQYCDIAFTNQLECAQHEARHDAANPFVCNFCPYRTSNRATLIQHIKELHNNERPFVCVACNKGFCRRSDLKKHSIVHTGVKPFTCHLCQKTFSRNTNLTKHLKIHTEAKTHVCDKCPRAFFSAADLLRHQRMHLPNKQYKCGKCELIFNSRDKLFVHQKIHSTQSDVHSQSAVPSPVHFLDYSFVSPPPVAAMPQHHQPPPELPYNQRHTVSQPELPVGSLLHSHLTRDNFGQQQQSPDYHIKILKCHDCAKTFTKKRELERHQLISHPEKLFSCKICSKKFNRKDKLMRHERMHAELKIHSCSRCELSFSKQEALEMHVKVNHPESVAAAAAHVNNIHPPGFYNNAFQQQQPYQPRAFGLGFYSEIRPDD